MSTIWGLPTISTLMDFEPPPLLPPPPPAPAHPDNVSPATAGTAIAIAILFLALIFTSYLRWIRPDCAWCGALVFRWCGALCAVLGPDHLRSEHREPARLAGRQAAVGHQRLEVRDVGEPAEAGDPELRVQPYEDAASGAHHDLALDRRDGRVGGGQSVLPRDAVRAQEGQVDDEVAEHPERPVVDGRERPAAEPASQQQDGDVLGVGEGACGEQ